MRKAFTLIELMIVIAIIAIIAAIAIPNLIEARKHGNEAAAVGALRTVTTAQSIFRESDRNRNGIFEYGALSDLGGANLVDTVLSAGTKQGYTFTVTAGDAATGAGTEYVWYATCDPVVQGSTGDRYFGTNQGGVIYFSNTGTVTFQNTDNAINNGTAIGGR